MEKHTETKNKETKKTQNTTKRQNNRNREKDLDNINTKGQSLEPSLQHKKQEQ